MKSGRIQKISKLMNMLGISNLGLSINNLIYRKYYIRAINYHSTLGKDMEQFERQLQFFSKHYASVSKEELIGFLNGTWNKKKPGLIISFDDGLESNFKYAKPLLERYGFIGWFFIPTGLVGSGKCIPEHLTGTSSERYMNLEEIKQLSYKHVLGSHTVTHKRLSKKLAREILEKEIIDSKVELGNMINSDVDIFCWVGGETESYSKEASDIIKKSGYKFSFLTNHFPILKNSNSLQLERTNIEADWPLHLVKLYMSPLMDLKYRKKRKYVKNLLR